MNPFAPHLCHELWQKLDNKTILDKESWPVFHAALIEEKEFELIIQINGKIRDKVTAPMGIDQKEAEKRALASDATKKWLQDAIVKKVIFVPNRLINFIV